MCARALASAAARRRPRARPLHGAIGYLARRRPAGRPQPCAEFRPGLRRLPGPDEISARRFRPTTCGSGTGLPPRLRNIPLNAPPSSLISSQYTWSRSSPSRSGSSGPQKDSRPAMRRHATAERTLQRTTYHPHHPTSGARRVGTRIIRTGRRRCRRSRPAAVRRAGPPGDISCPIRSIATTPAVSTADRAQSARRRRGCGALLPWLSDEGLLAFTEVQRRNAPPRPKVVPAARFATLRGARRGHHPGRRAFAGREARRGSPTTSTCCSASRRSSCKSSGSKGSPRSTPRPRPALGSPFARLDAASTGRAHGRHQPPTSWRPVTPLEIVLQDDQTGDHHGYYTSEIGIHKELRTRATRCCPSSSGAPLWTARIAPTAGRRRRTSMQTDRTITVDLGDITQRVAPACDRHHPDERNAGTSSSSAAARPAAWRRSSSPRRASRCCCSKRAA